MTRGEADAKHDNTAQMNAPKTAHVTSSNSLFAEARVEDAAAKRKFDHGTEDSESSHDDRANSKKSKVAGVAANVVKTAPGVVVGGGDSSSYAEQGGALTAFVKPGDALQQDNDEREARKRGPNVSFACVGAVFCVVY